MAFMIPEYSCDVFLLVENEKTGESYLGPSQFDSPCEDEENQIRVTIYEDKWFCRLSAPGYMDCTDWSGPFDTEKEAREHIIETYEVDADTGDELPEA